MARLIYSAISSLDGYTDVFVKRKVGQMILEK
jgi:hypothetical protein